ncbi:MAG TPA: hypothetical protein VFU02_03045 [Polyangiaceae bacterium]|nr:hypothetical protein [Polyangiaceae bacterium]
MASITSVCAFCLLPGLAACSSDDSGYAVPTPDSTSDAVSSTGTSSSTTGGVTSDGGNVSNTSAIGAASTVGLELTTNTSTSTAGVPPGLGQEDLCDSIDNDGNGIVDDVDVGGDGVCDCLRIATLGVPGMWGEGDVFDAWLDSRSNNGAVDLGDAVLSAETLSPYHVIVAQDLSANHAYSAEEVQALDAWVKAGGGFMTLIGFADPDVLDNVNTLLASFGLSYGPDSILPRRGGETVPVTEWLEHPVTAGISLIGMDNGYPVQGGTPIAMEQGFEVLTPFETELGHVLVWGDEWITYNSEWTEHPEYQVELFWVNSIKWLTAVSDCQVPIPEQIK